MVRCVQTKCCLYIFWGGGAAPKVAPPATACRRLWMACHFMDGAIWIRFDCLTCHSYSHKIGTTGICTSSSTRCNKLSISDRCCSIAVCETSPWLDVWLLRVLFGNCHKHWSHGHDTLAKKNTECASGRIRRSKWHLRRCCLPKHIHHDSDKIKIL